MEPQGTWNQVLQHSGDQSTKDDLVDWFTSNEERDVLLMSGLHGECEWLSDVGDGSGS